MKLDKVTSDPSCVFRGLHDHYEVRISHLMQPVCPKTRQEAAYWLYSGTSFTESPVATYRQAGFI